MVSRHQVRFAAGSPYWHGGSNGELFLGRWLDQGAVGADFDGQAAVRLGRSGGGASQCDATRQGMCQESLGKMRAAAKEWAAIAMTRGAKLAHRCTGRIGARFKTWVAKWQKTQDSTQDTVMAIQEVRACAKAEQDTPKIELKNPDEALATMNEGADRFGFRFIKSLPKTGRQMVVDLLNECEEQVARPWQENITMVCLLAKEVKRRATRLPPDHALPHLARGNTLRRSGATRRRGSGTTRCEGARRCRRRCADWWLTS